jgi:hypothetical protein
MPEIDVEQREKQRIGRSMFVSFGTHHRRKKKESACMHVRHFNGVVEIFFSLYVHSLNVI